MEYDVDQEREYDESRNLHLLESKKQNPSSNAAVCTYFQKYGKCKFGEKCSFKHAQSTDGATSKNTPE